MSYQSNHLKPIRVILRTPLKISIWDNWIWDTRISKWLYGSGTWIKTILWVLFLKQFEEVWRRWEFSSYWISNPCTFVYICSTAHQPFIHPSKLPAEIFPLAFIHHVDKSKKSPCHHAILHACLILYNGHQMPVTLNNGLCNKPCDTPVQPGLKKRTAWLPAAPVVE